MISFNRRGLLKKIGGLLGFITIPGCLSFLNKEKTMQKMKKVIYHQKPVEQHWVGDGFHVHTMMQPHPNTYPMTSPFILMDYAPPRNFTPNSAQPRGVGEHPHRGFETVTFAYQGEITHRDSAGGGGTIGQGDVQWMTAASGVVHEELHSKSFSEKGGSFEMVQLWVNLPKAKKMSSPNYQGVKDQQFTRFILGSSCEGRLIAGEVEEKKGPCSTHTAMNVFDLSFQSQESISIQLEEKTNTVLFVLRGSIEIDKKSYGEKEILALSREGEDLLVRGEKGSKVLVLNAEPIDEPIFAYGPFVMNTREEVVQAFDDYQSGKMGHLK